MTMWGKIRLGEVLALYDTSVPVSQLAIVNLAGVYSFARGLFKRGTVSPGQTSYKAYNRLSTNDFVISQPKGWEGALARVTPDFEGWYLSPVFPTFRVNRARLEPKFLEWFCKREPIWAELRRNSRGIGARRETVSPEQFLSLEIPLPPLAEQTRVVARIEDLTNRIRVAVELRSEARAETYALIEAVKRRCIGDPKRNSMNWPVLPLRQIADMRYGISAPISGAIYADLGTPIVRMANIGLDGSLDLSNLRYYAMNERERAVFLLNPGDLLLNWRSGSANHVGKTAIFKNDGDFTFASFLLRIRVNPIHTSPEYLKLILNFMRSEGVFLDAQRFQVNTKLNADEFGNFDVILPPRSEQDRIIANLTDVQEKTDDLKSLQAETSAEIDALMPSILDKAFRGEL